MKRKHQDLTEFQEKVYKAVSSIPEGQVRSYEWVALRIGNPRSCRAVGQALNKNMNPIIIPCHRVIRKDGSIGGYGGGIKLKKEILKKEGYRA